MANNCYFYLKAVGKDGNSLKRLYEIMNGKDPEYFVSGVREAYAYDTHGSDRGFEWTSTDNANSGGMPASIYAQHDGEDGQHEYKCLVITGTVRWNAQSWFEGKDDPKTLGFGDWYCTFSASKKIFGE